MHKARFPPLKTDFMQSKKRSPTYVAQAHLKYRLIKSFKYENTVKQFEFKNTLRLPTF